MSNILALTLSTNYLGATIFWLYILFALTFTAVILQTLLQLHQIRRVADNGAQTPWNVWLFAALALVSFATLSFNMLNVLIQSFNLWSNNTYPAHLLGWPGSAWDWSIHSNLFQDFGEAIVANSARFLWTQSALLATLSICFYIAVQGRQYGVPRLWAFFAISQILPISFAQNLLYVALSLSATKEPSGQAKKAEVPKLFSVAAVALYCSCLANAQVVAGTAWLMPLILAARALLLAPLSLVKTKLRVTNEGAEDSLSSSGIQRVVLTTALVMSGIKALQARDEGWSIDAVWSALFSHPAVSSLGCDFLLSGVSFLMWTSLHDGEAVDGTVQQAKKK
jgi:hypothetical protein